MAQRNNIAKLPPGLRDKVSALLYDNTMTQAEMQAAVREEAVRIGRPEYAKVRIHGTSFTAWRKSTDYADYVEFARGWDDKTRKRRWAAAAMNEGRGPQSLADIAEMEILEQLHDLAAGGLLETGKDVATVARAITSLQRTQLARAESDRDQRIAAIEVEHALAIATLQGSLQVSRDEVARLRACLAEHKIDPDAVRAPDAGLSDAALAEMEARAKLL